MQHSRRRTLHEARSLITPQHITPSDQSLSERRLITAAMGHIITEIDGKAARHFFSHSMTELFAEQQGRTATLQLAIYRDPLDSHPILATVIGYDKNALYVSVLVESGNWLVVLQQSEGSRGNGHQ